MYPCWVDPNSDALQQIALDSETYCAGHGNVDLSPEQSAAAEDALLMATEILTRLTGYHIHGPGYALDEYMLWQGTPRRLAVTFRPLRAVKKVEHFRLDGSFTEISDAHVVGQVVFLPFPAWGGVGCGAAGDYLRLTYRFGSTVTRGARSTALYYARQLYLAGPCGDASECQLPERITSITREGISMTTIDPQTFLDRGMTGLIRVDEWLAGYAHRKGFRSSAVYGVDSPPPVNRGVWCGDALPDAGDITVEALSDD